MYVGACYAFGQCRFTMILNKSGRKDSMETAIIVVCVVIAVLLLAAIVYKAVLLAKRIRRDKEASDAEDGNVRCLEIV